MSLMRDVTARYSPVEAWIYDVFVSPAVLQARDRIFKETPALESLPPGAAVLDVGCGGGQIAAELARENPTLRVFGLDFAMPQIRRARRRSRDVRFVPGSALELPFPDGAFDLVYSIGSIKHWPDRARGLSECVRVLRPGGRLLVLDLDRECTVEESREFVRMTRFPRFIQPLWMKVFRAKLVEPSLTPAEARGHCRRLPLEELRAERLSQSPAFVLYGRKAS